MSSIQICTILIEGYGDQALFIVSNDETGIGSGGMEWVRLPYHGVEPEIRTSIGSPTFGVDLHRFINQSGREGAEEIACLARLISRLIGDYTLLQATVKKLR